MQSLNRHLQQKQGRASSAIGQQAESRPVFGPVRSHCTAACALSAARSGPIVCCARPCTLCRQSNAGRCALITVHCGLHPRLTLCDIQQYGPTTAVRTYSFSPAYAAPDSTARPLRSTIASVSEQHPSRLPQSSMWPASVGALFLHGGEHPSFACEGGPSLVIQPKDKTTKKKNIKREKRQAFHNGEGCPSLSTVPKQTKGSALPMWCGGHPSRFLTLRGRA